MRVVPDLREFEKANGKGYWKTVTSGAYSTSLRAPGRLRIYRIVTSEEIGFRVLVRRRSCG